MNHTLNKKIKKRKFDLIRPPGLPYDLIFPDYNGRGYDIVVRKNNDRVIIVPNIGN